MTFEEWLVLRDAENERQEKERYEMEERELRHLAKFREVFRNWPGVIARIDEPVPIEDRIRQRRVERAAGRRGWTRHGPGCAAA